MTGFDDSPDPDRHDSSVDDRISRDLGIDVGHVESVALFHLDHARIKRGERPRLGYLMLQRQYQPDCLVVFEDQTTAEQALTAHPLVDQLCEEDCLGLDLLRNEDITIEHLRDIQVFIV